MTTILLSPQGVFPDVCLSAWGFTVAYKQGKDGPLVIQIRDTDGRLASQFVVDTEMPDSTFARVSQALGKTWVAYRAFRNGQESAVVREVLQSGLGTEQVLGPTFGNNPVCLSSDGLVAWQDQSRQVQGLRLSDGETLILRFETRPTGIAYLDGDQPVFVDDNRLSEPGMLNPVRAGALTVGEGPVSGLLAKLEQRFGQVLGGECFVPRCADLGESRYAAVTWGPGVGATLVLFEPADIQEPEPVPLEPIPAVNRALWFGAYDRNQDGTFPGNSRIRWSPTEPAVLETLDGRDIAYYVSGDPDGDPDAIERACVAAQAFQPPLPVLAYVPHGVAFPPSADWIGLEAYQKTWETLPQFEQARRQRASGAGRPVVLIPQVYSSNANNTKELRPLVPIYGRFLRDVTNCIGSVAFSAGSWRATGYEDHPEVWPLYQQLASTIRLPASTMPGSGPIPTPPQPSPLPVPPPLVPEPDVPHPSPLPPPVPEPQPVPQPMPPPQEPEPAPVPDEPEPHTNPPAPAPQPPSIPPLPTPDVPLATSYEVLMETETVHLLGPGGKFARVDPATPTVITFDRDSAGPHEEYELSKPDDQFTIRAMAANVILAGMPNQTYETRPASARGPWEAWTIVTMPDGKILAYVAHEVDGRQYTSAPLTVVSQA